MIKIFVAVPLRGHKTMTLETSAHQSRLPTKVPWRFQFTLMEVLDALCDTIATPVTLVVRPATGKDTTMDLKPGKAWPGQRKHVVDILTQTVRTRNLLVSDKNRKNKAKPATKTAQK